MKKSTSSLSFFHQSPIYLFQCNNEAPEGPNRRFGSFPINLSQKHFSTYKPPTYWLDGDVLKALGKMYHRVPRHDTDKLVAEHGMVKQQPVGSWKHWILGLRVTHNHETVTFFFLFTSLSNQPNYTGGVQKDLRCEVRKGGGKAWIIPGRCAIKASWGAKKKTKQEAGTWRPQRSCLSRFRTLARGGKKRSGRRSFSSAPPPWLKTHFSDDRYVFIVVSSSRTRNRVGNW